MSYMKSVAERVSEVIGDGGELTMKALATTNTIMTTSAGWYTGMISDLYETSHIRSLTDEYKQAAVMALGNDFILDALGAELRDYGFNTNLVVHTLLLWRDDALYTLYINDGSIIVTKIGTDYPLDIVMEWQVHVNMYIADITQEVLNLTNQVLLSE